MVSLHCSYHYHSYIAILLVSSVHIASKTARKKGSMRRCVMITKIENLGMKVAVIERKGQGEFAFIKSYSDGERE
jgi:hypothetical protein